MFDKLYQSFRKSARVSNVLILFLAYLVFAVVILPWASSKLKSVSHGMSPVDLPFSYSTEQVYKILKSYGGEGREWYTLMELTIYTVYPLVYSILAGMLIIILYSRLALKENFIKILFLIPVIALLADYAEGFSMVLMLVNYPYKLETIAALANVCTQIKWIFLIAGVGLSAVGALLVLIRYIHFRFIVKSISR